MTNIRLCRKDERPFLQRFLHEHWRNDHILSHHQELLEWQHKNGEHFNFWVVDSEVPQEYDAIIGFIPTGQFDSKLATHGDVWPVTWKVAKKNKSSLAIGIELMNQVEEKHGFGSIASVGLNPKTLTIYKYLEYTTGVLDHYFFLNPETQVFSIAEITENKSRDHQEGPFTIRELTSLDPAETINDTYYPKKSAEYFRQRYQDHPIYTYQFWGIYRGEALVSVWVIRKIAVGDANCLRIIDIIGKVEPIYDLGSELSKMLAQEKSEYIDLLTHGIDETVLQQMGFQKKEKDQVVIPHYFSPFERRNIDILFAYKTNYESYTIFKGDSDQDRPN